MRLWLMLAALPLTAAPQPQNSGVVMLTVVIYDLKGMRSSDLVKALNQATRVFRAAGIELSCSTGSLAAPEAHLLGLSVPPGTHATAPRLIVVRIINKRTPAFPPETIGWS